MKESITVDMTELGRLAQTAGPQWSTETDDLDVTLLTWPAGGGVASHVNSEVDVVTVIVAGEAEVRVGETSARLYAGHTIVIPKGLPRSLTAGEGGVTHLNIHRRRKRLGLSGGDAFRDRSVPK
ncbi:MAG: cupin domain-containing protein [Fimbriimonas sp.]